MKIKQVEDQIRLPFDVENVYQLKEFLKSSFIPNNAKLHFVDDNCIFIFDRDETEEEVKDRIEEELKEINNFKKNNKEIFDYALAAIPSVELNEALYKKGYALKMMQGDIEFYSINSKGGELLLKAYQILGKN